MKKLLQLLIVAVGVSAAAMAQPPAEQKDHKNDRAEWEKKIKDELQLTTDQVVKFDAICKEYNGKIEAIAQDATLTKEAQKEKKMALKKEKEAKFFEFFTPDQQEKYRELIEKKKKEMEKKDTGTKPTGGT